MGKHWWSHWMPVGGLTDFQRRAKTMAMIRSRWGQPGQGKGWYASKYFELVKDACAETVSDKVWSDLEFERIFCRMDTAVTPIGRQVLYRQMREYVEAPAELASRYTRYQWLMNHPQLRENIQQHLLSLQNDNNAFLARFIYSNNVDRPRWAKLLPLCVFAGAVVPVGVIGFGWPGALWAVVIVVNLLVTSRLWWNGAHHAEWVIGSLELLATGERLAGLSRFAADLQPLQRLRQGAAGRRRARKVLREFLLTRLPGLSFLAPMANALFALEPVLYVRVAGKLGAVRPQLAQVYEMVGELDANIAVASFLAGQLRYCAPALIADLSLRVVDGGHPLIDDCVPNSIELQLGAALITGSNMAGKTSFIKSMGIQVILGRTLGFCLATAAEIPAIRVMTSIHVAHSVEAKVSHFFSELETIRQFMLLQTAGTPTLFVIDEIFSGTNTVERIACARAVLERLAQGCMVLVTTHDVELQSCLQPAYELYHFQENIEVDGFFDYRLRVGAATQRNAIKLLGKIGYPADLVATALGYADNPQS